jgi:hypothetical protein
MCKVLFGVSKVSQGSLSKPSVLMAPVLIETVGSTSQLIATLSNDSTYCKIIILLLGVYN